MPGRQRAPDTARQDRLQDRGGRRGRVRRSRHRRAEALDHHLISMRSRHCLNNIFIRRLTIQIQGGAVGRGLGLDDLDLGHYTTCLHGCTGADESLAELTVQQNNMVEHLNQSQPNPGP